MLSADRILKGYIGKGLCLGIYFNLKGEKINPEADGFS